MTLPKPNPAELAAQRADFAAVREKIQRDIARMTPDFEKLQHATDAVLPLSLSLQVPPLLESAAGQPEPDLPRSTPPEFRSKPKPKFLLAKLHSGVTQSNPAQYLKRQGIILGTSDPPRRCPGRLGADAKAAGPGEVDQRSTK